MKIEELKFRIRVEETNDGITYCYPQVCCPVPFKSEFFPLLEHLLHTVAGGNYKWKYLVASKELGATPIASKNDNDKDRLYGMDIEGAQKIIQKFKEEQKSIDDNKIKSVTYIQV